MDQALMTVAMPGGITIGATDGRRSPVHSCAARRLTRSVILTILLSRVTRSRRPRCAVVGTALNNSRGTQLVAFRHWGQSLIRSPVAPAIAGRHLQLAPRYSRRVQART